MRVCISTLFNGGDFVIRRSVSFSERAEVIIQEYAQENEISFSQAVNEMICQQQIRNSEQIADVFLKKMDEHYSKLLTRLRLGVSETDKNVQVVIEILNSILFFEKKEYGLMPTEVSSHEVVTEARDQVKDRIARFKQINDSKKRKKYDK